MTSAVMLAACLLACIGPARRALRINPTDALQGGLNRVGELPSEKTLLESA